MTDHITLELTTHERADQVRHLLEATGAHGAALQALVDAIVTAWDHDVANVKRAQLSAEDELSFDEVEAIGLDGTGRDMNERFPYRWSNLTDDERRMLGIYRDGLIDGE